MNLTYDGLLEESKDGKIQQHDTMNTWVCRFWKYDKRGLSGKVLYCIIKLIELTTSDSNRTKGSSLLTHDGFLYILLLYYFTKQSLKTYIPGELYTANKVLVACKDVYQGRKDVKIESTSNGSKR